MEISAAAEEKIVAETAEKRDKNFLDIIFIYFLGSVV